MFTAYYLVPIYLLQGNRELPSETRAASVEPLAQRAGQVPVSMQLFEGFHIQNVPLHLLLMPPLPNNHQNLIVRKRNAQKCTSKIRFKKKYIKYLRKTNSKPHDDKGKSKCALKGYMSPPQASDRVFNLMKSIVTTHQHKALNLM